MNRSRDLRETASVFCDVQQNLTLCQDDKTRDVWRFRSTAGDSDLGPPCTEIHVHFNKQYNIFNSFEQLRGIFYKIPLRDILEREIQTFYADIPFVDSIILSH